MREGSDHNKLGSPTRRGCQLPGATSPAHSASSLPGHLPACSWGTPCPASPTIRPPGVSARSPARTTPPPPAHVPLRAPSPRTPPCSPTKSPSPPPRTEDLLSHGISPLNPDPTTPRAPSHPTLSPHGASPCPGAHVPVGRPLRPISRSARSPPPRGRPRPRGGLTPLGRFFTMSRDMAATDSGKRQKPADATQGPAALNAAHASPRAPPSSLPSHVSAGPQRACAGGGARTLATDP